ncbi:malonyl CoA-acyl carrier protein transacylase [Actinobacillus pleuropneumoniae]|nr:malonyl CoA-acyl carrier protein transacylase [Actinobacillus pleuropneumoniae]
MGKTAFIFPGQGAQSVGMGKDAYDAVPSARDLFLTADAQLGFPLSSIIFNGPDEDLKQTVNTQPALLATSMAYLEAVRGKGIVAGLRGGPLPRRVQRACMRRRALVRRSRVDR